MANVHVEISNSGDSKGRWVQRLVRVINVSAATCQTLGAFRQIRWPLKNLH